MFILAVKFMLLYALGRGLVRVVSKFIKLKVAKRHSLATKRREERMAWIRKIRAVDNNKEQIQEYAEFIGVNDGKAIVDSYQMLVQRNKTIKLFGERYERTYKLVTKSPARHKRTKRSTRSNRSMLTRLIVACNLIEITTERIFTQMSLVGGETDEYSQKTA